MWRGYIRYPVNCLLGADTANEREERASRQARVGSDLCIATGGS